MSHETLHIDFGYTPKGTNVYVALTGPLLATTGPSRVEMQHSHTTYLPYYQHFILPSDNHRLIKYNPTKLSFFQHAL